MRLRTAARLGADVRIGIGPTVTVDALPGIGPLQAEVLRAYGIHRVGLLAALPPVALQRLPVGRAGRPAADRALNGPPGDLPDLRRLGSRAT
ncbi:MAG TPA: hypothetical protein VLG91_10150 [Streptomyces sp.]|nr:hypothetical protein [Streptomyces sp.]